jgi:tetratricopeptide (TPR) repeat protein
MKRRIGFLIFLCLVLPASAFAESARSLNARGNERYAEGNYDAALKAYEEAQAAQPEAAEISFNKGNAYFQQGDYEKARESYEMAALRTQDQAFEARAQYNLGNTAYFEGQKYLKGDLKKALAAYGLSIRHFQDALRLDPGLQEAGKNIEIVRLEIKDLRDQIKKLEDQAKQAQEQQQEVQRLLKEAIQEQDTEIKENAALRKKPTEALEKPVEGDPEKLLDDQKRTREKTGKASEIMNSMASSQGAGAEGNAQLTVAEHLEKAAQEQESAIDRIKGSELEAAQDHQEQALDDLKEALAKLSESEKSQKSSPNPQGEGEPKPESASREPSDTQQKDGGKQPSGEQGREAQPQPADDGQKALAAREEQPKDILQEEKENRLHLQRSFNVGTKPVEKDW